MTKNKNTILAAAFTSANMLFGFLAILKIISGDFHTAGWLIIIAAIMDGLDGKIARLDESLSQFGKEFDSLADLISFGVAPALLAYHIYLNNFNLFGTVLAFIFVLCGAFRLARFNAVTGYKEVFTGLPIPIAAITTASFVNLNLKYFGDIASGALFTALMAVVCFLMVSHIQFDKMPRLSFKYTKANRVKLSILIVSLILIAVEPATFFFPLCVIYIMHGIIRSVIIILRNSVRQADEFN